MAEIKVTIDTKAVDQLADELKAAGRAVLDNLLEEAEEFVREEAPERTGRLKKDQNSVFSETRQTATGFEGDLIISAFRERTGARAAVIHYPSGTTKQVSLRPQPQFNYAEAVARGRKEVRPREAKVLLIPVKATPSNEAYVTSGGETFVLRRSAKATKPNPYPERALKRLEGVAREIAENTLANFGLLR